MRDLLYVPPSPPAATHAIGLLVPELANPIFPALAQAMEERASDAGLATIFCHTAGDASREADYVHMLLERKVDGMIFISCEATDLRGNHAHYPRLIAEGARLVFVNSSVEDLDVTSVGIDERFAGELAADHLLALGHTRVGFVAGPRHALPTREKLLGINLALERAGGADPLRIAHADWGYDGGRKAMTELLAARGGPPTGVVCSSDLMAIGALAVLREAGLRVPEDVSIVGFDGIDTVRWTDPPLTTLEQPIAEIASTAVEALRTLIDDPTRTMPNFVFRPVLREGASTAPPRATV